MFVAMVCSTQILHGNRYVAHSPLWNMGYIAVNGNSSRQNCMCKNCGSYLHFFKA